MAQDIQPLHEALIGKKCVVPVPVWRPTYGDHERCPPTKVQGATRAVPVRILCEFAHYEINSKHASFVIFLNIDMLPVLKLCLPWYLAIEEHSFTGVMQEIFATRYVGLLV